MSPMSDKRTGVRSRLRKLRSQLRLPGGQHEEFSSAAPIVSRDSPGNSFGELQTTTMRALFLLVLIDLSPSRLVSQVNASARTDAAPALKDNSFFIEEAYNQEEGIVQHISGFLYSFAPDRQLTYSFTEEWPLAGTHQQLSYTLPMTIAGSEHQAGIGDIILNYRFELTDQEQWAAIAPRVSLLLPTGDAQRGLGWGVFGGQLNIPLSAQLSEPFTAHANLGVTYLPHISRDLDSGERARHTLVTFNAGGSIIWLASELFNVMLEYTAHRSIERFENGTTRHSTESIVCPGFRFAVNVENLQIVPGIGIPVFLTRDVSHSGVYFYLSFEHPF